MEEKKDIRFSEKKVDGSWKEQTAATGNAANETQPKGAETSKPFLGIVQSIGLQALIHLGAIPNPMTKKTEKNIEVAKETIDVLAALRDKTSGNLSDEEKKFVEGLLSELQVKFSQSV